MILRSCSQLTAKRLADSTSYGNENASKKRLKRGNAGPRDRRFLPRQRYALVPRLFFREIVFKVRSEVMTMQEAYVSRPRGLPKDTVEYERIKEAFKGEEKRIERFRQCIDDAWDLRDEKTCVSVRQV